MKTIAALWAAGAVALVAWTVTAQEMTAVDHNWAACRSLGVWEAQERVRHDQPQKWLGWLAPYVQKGECTVTRKGMLVGVIERADVKGHDVLRVVIANERGEWWLSPEAVR